MIEAYVDVVKKSPLFFGIKEEDITSLLECFTSKVHSYGKNESIMDVGDTMNKFGIILEGEAMVLKENVQGSRVIMSVLNEGDIFGEMLVFSSRKTSPVSVRVESSCKVLFITSDNLVNRCEKLCPWHNAIIQNFMKILSNKALMLNKKVEYLSIKSIRGKIAAYLLEQYEHAKDENILLPLKRNELADFLNVSRPSMSREMAKMREEGIIDFHLSTFRIKDMETLRYCCDY